MYVLRDERYGMQPGFFEDCSRSGWAKRFPLFRQIFFFLSRAQRLRSLTRALALDLPRDGTSFSLNKCLALMLMRFFRAKVILASDTVYPGKPFSDAEAFFAMVAKLLVSSTHSRSFFAHVALKPPHDNIPHVAPRLFFYFDRVCLGCRAAGSLSTNAVCPATLFSTPFLAVCTTSSIFARRERSLAVGTP